MKLQVYQVLGIMHIHTKEKYDNKRIVCDSCEASFTVEYEMLGHQYVVKVCPFCGAELDEDMSHEIEVNDDDDPYQI